MTNTCRWRYDEWHSKFDTDCGNAHVFIEGGPTDNNYKFCPYCGAEICEGRPHEAQRLSVPLGLGRPRKNARKS